MKAKKSLGQNFLKNDTIVNQIVSLLNVTENDLIIEIGPGRGALTAKLIELPSKLLCIEIDTDMKKYLDKFESSKCKIIYDDFLKLNPNEITCKDRYNKLYIIGNLPYYITSPIMEHLINSHLNIDEMVFMVQKEVADRYSAKPGSKEYGYMTLFLDYYYDVSEKIFVSKDNFVPIPKVDSAVIKLVKKNVEFNIDVRKYFDFLKDAFRYKRKTLKNNLNNYNFSIIKKVLARHKLDETVRSEEISQDVFLEIFKELNN